MVSEVGRGRGLARTIFYLPTLAPAVADALGFIYILNPPPVRSTGFLGGPCTCHGRCGSSRPAWAKPSLCHAGLWGIGDIIVIFLAALLDVPSSCTRPAELDGAAGGSGCATSRCRPSARCCCSPCVTGDDRRRCSTSPRRTSRHSRPAAAARRRIGQPRSATPQGSTLFYPDVLVPAGLRLLQHRLRVGDGLVLLIVVFFVHGWSCCACRGAGCTTAGGPDGHRGQPPAAAAAPRSRTAPVGAPRRAQRLTRSPSTRILVVLAIVFVPPLLVWCSPR